MDAGSAPPPCYQAVDVPTDIFKPLLEIAQRNYHPDEIREYYRTMVRHLRRMGAQNVDAAYTIMTPASDRKISLPVGEAALIQVTTTESDHVSPKTVPILEEHAFEPSYEPGQFDHLHTNQTTECAYPIMEENLTPVSMEVPPPQPPRPIAQQQQQQNVLMTTTSFDPPPVRPLGMDHMHARSVSADQLPYTMGQQQLQPQWMPQPGMLNSASSPPLEQARFVPNGTPSPMPYQMTVPQNPVQFANPFQPPPPQQQMMYHHPQQADSADDFRGGPLSNTLGLSNFSHDLYSNSLYSMIDVIPSRKRRKQLQKGVRRITQSIPLPRQM
jgi:hypothetical protein